MIRGRTAAILSANHLGYVLYSPAFLAPARPVNLARLVFLNGGSAEFCRDWDRIARDAVGSLRAEAGRNPHDKALTGLVGELATRRTVRPPVVPNPLMWEPNGET